MRGGDFKPQQRIGTMNHCHGGSVVLRVAFGSTSCETSRRPLIVCVFCEIAAGRQPERVVYEDSEFIAFMDHRPIQPGHLQLIPRIHVVGFETMEPELAGRMMNAAQRLARALKEVTQAPRVALAFSGGEISHVHAHLIPVHKPDDITSARLTDPDYQAPTAGVFAALHAAIIQRLAR